MVLDDLKEAVAKLDQRVAQAGDLGVAAYTGQRLDRIRASLRPVLWEHVGQMALGVLIALAVGPFWLNELSRMPAVSKRITKRSTGVDRSSVPLCRSYVPATTIFPSD